MGKGGGWGGAWGIDSTVARNRVVAAVDANATVRAITRFGAKFNLYDDVNSWPQHLANWMWGRGGGADASHKHLSSPTGDGDVYPTARALVPKPQATVTGRDGWERFCVSAWLTLIEQLEVRIVIAFWTPVPVERNGLET